MHKVALDPRGMGLSTPIQCSIDLWNERASLFPTTQSEFDELVSHNKALGESCIELSGNIVKHVDTVSVAKDFEAVRLALGGEKFNYLGFSYGSQILLQYATLFPDAVGRAVGDGLTNHEQDETSDLVTEVNTYENVFDLFVEWCNTTTDCALHGQDVGALFDELVANASATPIAAPGAYPTAQPNVTGEELRFNVQDNLVSVNASFGPGWAALSEMLALALAGNATALATPLAIANETEANSALFAGLAVGCLDWFHSSTSVSDQLYKSQLTSSIAPHTRGASQTYTYQSKCLGWPAPIVNPPRKAIISDKIAPVLLVNALHDPETGYEWAVGLQKQVPNSVLLTRNGIGHTSYLLGGEAMEVMNAFVVNGTLPGENSVVDS
jgi:pimeloyl-ACP methyl ester carboxylesterase